MTQAQKALEAIKTSMTNRPMEDMRTSQRHVWENVIQSAEGYDEEASGEADPSETNAEAVFADGSRLWWNYSLNEWETGP